LDGLLKPNQEKIEGKEKTEVTTISEHETMVLGYEEQIDTIRGLRKEKEEKKDGKKLGRQTYQLTQYTSGRAGRPNENVLNR
jgi:hypothetical protein